MNNSLVFHCIMFDVKAVSVECRKTNTNVITLPVTKDIQ